MAQSRRVEKVAALIRREISELLISGLRDERVNHSMITITDVTVSGDLQHCKIFVSVFGDPHSHNTVMEGLQAASSFLRGELARRLQMRRAPEVIFKLDRGIEKGTAVLNLLDKLKNERKDRQL